MGLRAVIGRPTVKKSEKCKPGLEPAGVCRHRFGRRRDLRALGSLRKGGVRCRRTRCPKKVRSQIAALYSAARCSFDLHRHFGGHALRPQHVGYLLLRTADSLRKRALRAELADGPLDMLNVCHTRILVTDPGQVKQKSCLSPNRAVDSLAPTMTIGANLKRIRKEARLSQMRLADLAGVSQQLISQIENDVNRSTKELPALAKALHVPVSAIDPNFLDVSPEDARLLEKIRMIAEGASAEELRLLESHLDFLIQLRRGPQEPPDNIE